MASDSSGNAKRYSRQFRLQAAGLVVEGGYSNSKAAPAIGAARPASHELFDRARHLSDQIAILGKLDEHVAIDVRLVDPEVRAICVNDVRSLLVQLPIRIIRAPARISARRYCDNPQQRYR